MNEADSDLWSKLSSTALVECVAGFTGGSMTAPGVSRLFVEGLALEESNRRQWGNGIDVRHLGLHLAESHPLADTWGPVDGPTQKRAAAPGQLHSGKARPPFLRPV